MIALIETCKGLSKPVSGEKATRKGGFLVCGDFDCWLEMLLQVGCERGWFVNACFDQCGLSNYRFSCAVHPSGRVSAGLVPAFVREINSCSALVDRFTDLRHSNAWTHW